MTAPKTLYDKIWDDHVADEADDGTCLLYIDRHLVHEVTSPQAFEGLRNTARTVRAPHPTRAPGLTCSRALSVAGGCARAPRRGAGWARPALSGSGPLSFLLTISAFIVLSFCFSTGLFILP